MAATPATAGRHAVYDQEGNQLGDELYPYLATDLFGRVVSPDSGIPIKNSKLVTARLAVGVIGDSFAANGDGNASGASAPGPTSLSFTAWALSQVASRTPYHIAANRGVGGKTVDLVITEQLPLILADNIDILHIHAGINNLNPTYSTDTVNQIIGKMDYLLSQAMNVPLILLDAVCPLAFNSISGAYPRRAEIPALNEGYRLLAEKYPNVIYCDVFTPLFNTLTGYAFSNLLQADGIHPNTWGACVAGMQIAKYLVGSFVTLRRVFRPSRVPLIPRISGNTGTKSAGAGTINGEVATGYTVSIASNAAGVVVTASVDSVANKQTLRIQNGNASASVTRLVLSDAAAPAANFVNGDIAQAVATINVLNAAGLRRHDVSITTGAVAVASSMQRSGQEAVPVHNPEPLKVTLDAIYVFPGTPADLNIFTSIEVAPGGDVTVEISNYGLQEVIAA